MKIAVACAGLNVAPYFSQCSNYMCYTVDRGIIVGSQNMPALDQPLEQLIELLRTIGMDTLIVGRIEYDMASKLCISGIEVVAGAEGTALDVAKAYVNRTLSGVSDPCSSDEDESDDVAIATSLPGAPASTI